MLRQYDWKNAAVGVGFAFTMGWLWFPWLAAIWLPGTVWGSASSGGGLFFLVLLCVGFSVSCAPAAHRRLASCVPESLVRFIQTNARHLCHGVAYSFVLIVFFFPGIDPRLRMFLPPYLVLALMAVFFVIMGLYWGSRLVALSPVGASFAFFSGVLSAAILGLFVNSFPVNSHNIIWPHGVLLAWILAIILHRLDKPQPKSRGRPPLQKTTREILPLGLTLGKTQRTDSRTLLSLAVVVLTIGILDAAAWILNGNEYGVPTPLSIGLPLALGVSIPTFLVGKPSDRFMGGLLAAATVALFLGLGAAAALLWPRSLPIFAALAEGAVTGLALAMLAGAPLDREEATRWAGMGIAVFTMLMNAGQCLGDFLAGWRGSGAIAIPTLAAGAAFIGIPVWEWRRDRRRGNSDSGDGNDPETSLFAFTREELNILTLVTREDETNQSIADQLFITRSTVRYHLKKIYSKTNTLNRKELAEFANRYLMDKDDRHV